MPKPLPVKRSKPPKFSHATVRGLGAMLLALGCGLMAWRAYGLPGAAILDGWLDLTHLSQGLHGRALHLLIAPLGALVVVIARLTLGIRVLGPFRSVLLAVAFQMTGPWVGVVAFAGVIAVVVLLRPLYRRMRLAYFGRSAAMLISVAVVIVGAMCVGRATGIESVERMAYFPLVVLTLAGDAAASTLRREGWRSASWRVVMTGAIGVMLALLTGLPGVADVMLRFPELAVVSLAGVVLVAEFAKFRALQFLNPPRAKKKKSSAAPALRADRNKAPATHEPAALTESFS